MADLDKAAWELCKQLFTGGAVPLGVHTIVLAALRQAHADGYGEAVEAYEARQKLLDSLPA